MKHYNVFSTHLKELFGTRVHKISVDAGFSCPNRGDERATGGCLFCEPDGSGAIGIERSVSIPEQIELAKSLMIRKYKAGLFIAYFQPYSNTFAPVPLLRERYDAALAVADVVGLSVGTRPDCLPQEVINLLREYHERTYFWLEIGLQSMHDRTLSFLRRGHDLNAFLDGYRRAKEAGLRICVHVILGLPGESREDMLATIDLLNALQVDGVKLHLLHVLRHTPLGELYEQGEISLLSQDAYVEIAVDVLERLDERILIHRLTGDGPRDLLLAPIWSLNKWEVLNAIDAELVRRESRQGFRGKGADQP